MCIRDSLKYAKNALAAGAPPRTPLGELTTLPRPPSRLKRGHPSPYPTPFGTDPPSALAMCSPQNSSQIYAYANTLGYMQLLVDLEYIHRDKMCLNLTRQRAIKTLTHAITRLTNNFIFKNLKSSKHDININMFYLKKTAVSFCK